MPIQTDTSVSPYFDDYNQEKDYYKILFRPGVAVQVRELNQLQSILQKQIERFGDNIFKRGTIVDGCSLTFENAIPYIKILDTTTDSTVANVAAYPGLAIKNENNNLQAYVAHTETGFIATAPNLKTLYLKYRNSGNDNQTNVYSSGNILTLYNDDYRIYSVNVISGSAGFTNSDSVVILSPVALQNSTGGTTFNASFQNGEVVTQVTTNAKAIVIASNTTANSSAIVLRIKPKPTDLAAQNTAGWAFTAGYEITGNTSGAVANVVSLVGSGATATLTTTGANNRANIITMANTGSSYYVSPHATISSLTASAGEITALSLDARNYLTKITVASTSTPVGTGYGMHVSSGIIYQKGYFERVEKQFAIVEKYSNTQSDKVIGFVTTESVVNSNSDSTLVDNANGFLNQNAPGANRLKLVPVLTTKTKSEAENDSEFFPLVEFSEGRPFRQFRSSQYNKINDEFARRTSEESGNFVLDPFLLTTKSVSTFANEANSFNIVIDPGHAYINGYRVQTLQNYATTVSKAKGYNSVTGKSIDITYGNYIKITDLAGAMNFTTSAQVSLRNTAQDFYTNQAGTANNTISGVGTEIGKARIRSVTLESGIPGTPEAVYRLYVFDVKMNSGKNFRDARSIYYDNGTFDSVADIKLEADATTGSSIAAIKEANNSFLIFGQDKINALKSATNLSYIYRTVNQTTANVQTSGILTITSGAGEVFPYTGTLSTAEKQDILIVPVANIISSTNIAGSVNFVGNVITGTSTVFVSALAAGDYIQINDGSNTDIVRVTSVTNATSLEVHRAPQYIDTAANVAIAFPSNVPIWLSTRSGRTANVVSNTTLNVNLGVTTTAQVNVAITYNLKVSSAAAVSKAVQRKNYVKINTASNVGSTSGPWCLGQSDVFRLRGVYAGTTTAATNITKHFYIDHNQNENYYDVGFLYKKPNSSYTVSGTILVEFDLFDYSSEGIKTIGSYTTNDDKTLTELTANEGLGVNTLEIPEIYSRNGRYFDLRDSFDFRPKTANTAALADTSGAAPTNPVEVTESTRFAAGNKKFPAPESDLFLDYNYYLPRVDTVLVKSSGDIQVLNNERRIEGNKDEIILNYIEVPQYPSLPEYYSTTLIELLDKNIANEKFTTKREEKYRVKSRKVNDQPRGYTMKEIGKLDRRIGALEYYTNLSRIEREVKDKVIPSQVDITLDRYKFGFFVDDFRNTQYSDIKNPEYNASIFEYRLYPKKKVLALEYKLSANTNNTLVSTGGVLTFPYEEYTLITQKNANNGPIGETTEPTETNYATSCVDVLSLTGAYDSNSNTIYTENTFTLTSNTDANGTELELYFNLFAGKDRIEIYQSTSIDSFIGTPVITSASANTLSQADKNELSNLKVGGVSDWGSLPARTFVTKDGDTTYWVKNTGKMTFNYSISNGRYFKVRVLKASPRHFYRICFPAEVIETTTTPTIEPITPVITPVIETKPTPIIITEPVIAPITEPLPPDSTTPEEPENIPYLETDPYVQPYDHTLEPYERLVYYHGRYWTYADYIQNS